MQAFHQQFQADSIRDLRIIEVDSREFALFEHFCVDPSCPCQIVLWGVGRKHAVDFAAWVSWCFDPAARARPELDPMHPQSVDAARLLATITGLVESDSAFRDQVVRHYKMMKSAELFEARTPESMNDVQRLHAMRLLLDEVSEAKTDPAVFLIAFEQEMGDPVPPLIELVAREPEGPVQKVAERMVGLMIPEHLRPYRKLLKRVMGDPRVAEARKAVLRRAAGKAP